MTEQGEFVCLRCGRPASDADVCVCGAPLAAMRGMLPTREQWEAPPPAEPLPPAEPEADAPARRRGPFARTMLAAWNRGGSATHRHVLNLTVLGDHTPQAVTATYAGSSRSLTRVGGGSPVLVHQGACIIAADGSLFVRQPNQLWGWVKADRVYPFPQIARHSTWTSTHANLSVHAAPVRTGRRDLGVVTPKSDTIVVLTEPDIGTPPVR
jgi:hypothetical protein